jgi:hypothetical protein
MLFWGFLGQTKMMRRCARERGVEEVQKSGGGVPYGVRIDVLQWRRLRIPASNSGSLGAQSEEREGEEWRGRCGGLIGVVGELFPLQINEGEWGVIGGVGYQ